MAAESGGVAVPGLGLSPLLVEESMLRSSGIIGSMKQRSAGPKPFDRSRSAGSFPIVSGSAPMCSRANDSSSSASNYASREPITKNPEICSLQETIGIRADGDDNPTIGAILPELV